MCALILNPNADFGNLAIWPIFGCWDLTTEDTESTEGET